MTNLTLWFNTVKEVSLLRTSFSHPLLGDEERKTIRGKIVEAYDGYSSFLWSPAVQAACLLFLKGAALALDRSKNNEPGLDRCFLEGEKGSPAATLDYAVAKQTNWLLDMFGVTYEGDPIIRRILARTNPERKRPGPVRVTIDQLLLPYQAIHIVVDGIETDNPLQVQQLHDHLASNWQTRTRPTSEGTESRIVVSGSASPDLARKLISIGDQIKTAHTFIAEQRELGELAAPFDNSGFRAVVRRYFVSEITSMLQAGDIFDRARVSADVEALTKNPWLKKIAGRNQKFVHDLDMELTGSSRIGLPNDGAEIIRALSRPEPIEFLLTPSQSASLAILNHLRYVRGFNVRANYQFAHSLEVVRALIDSSSTSPVPFCALSIASAAELMSLGSRTDYVPFMILPKLSFRVLAPKSEKEKSSPFASAEYAFLGQGITTSEFYFEELKRKKLVTASRSAVSHLEPHEIMTTLGDKNDGFRAIVWFPHYHFSSLMHGATLLSDPSNPSGGMETILFMHRSYEEQPNLARYVNIAIRDSWLSLRQDRRLVELMVDSIVEDRNYVRFLTRYGGLYNSPTINLAHVTAESVANL